MIRKFVDNKNIQRFDAAKFDLSNLVSQPLVLTDHVAEPFIHVDADVTTDGVIGNGEEGQDLKRKSSHELFLLLKRPRILRYFISDRFAQAIRDLLSNWVKNPEMLASENTEIRKEIAPAPVDTDDVGIEDSVKLKINKAFVPDKDFMLEIISNLRNHLGRHEFDVSGQKKRLIEDFVENLSNKSEMEIAEFLIDDKIIDGKEFSSFISTFIFSEHDTISETLIKSEDKAFNVDGSLKNSSKVKQTRYQKEANCESLEKAASSPLDNDLSLPATPAILESPAKSNNNDPLRLKLKIIKPKVFQTYLDRVTDKKDPFPNVEAIRQALEGFELFMRKTRDKRTYDDFRTATKTAEDFIKKEMHYILTQTQRICTGNKFSGVVSDPAILLKDLGLLLDFWGSIGYNFTVKGKFIQTTNFSLFITLTKMITDTIQGCFQLIKSSSEQFQITEEALEVAEKEKNKDAQYQMNLQAALSGFWSPELILIKYPHLRDIKLILWKLRDSLEKARDQNKEIMEIYSNSTQEVDFMIAGNFTSPMIETFHNRSNLVNAALEAIRTTQKWITLFDRSWISQNKT